MEDGNQPGSETGGQVRQPPMRESPQPGQADYRFDRFGNTPNPRYYGSMQDYGQPMTADQHRHRMQMMQMQEFDQRLDHLEDCIYELKDMMKQQRGSQQRGRSASGRFTSGPGSAGSRGYDEGYSDGRQEGYRDGRQEARDHVHRMNGYTGPSVPYEPQQSAANIQHWGRGGFYHPYYDPFLFYALASMQSGEIAVN